MLSQPKQKRKQSKLLATIINRQISDFLQNPFLQPVAKTTNKKPKKKTDRTWAKWCLLNWLVVIKSGS